MYIYNSFIFYTFAFYIVGVSDEALHSNKVSPEATDEHKGEDSDKVYKVKIFQEGKFFYVKDT